MSFASITAKAARRNDDVVAVWQGCAVAKRGTTGVDDATGTGGSKR